MSTQWPPDGQGRPAGPNAESPSDISASNSEPGGTSLNPSLINPTTERSGPQLVEPRPPEKPSPVSIWIDRIGLVIEVVFFIELGMLLAVLPWTGIWTKNVFLTQYPHIYALFQQNFFRGLVSGIGLVDIWVGIWVAVHYRDPK